jgi:alkanesulfonate monooxygenase SsuD/methylene tetrahydromethanopterin reductase-like flavin-dependent oxidoreductase (luciferase family)
VTDFGHDLLFGCFLTPDAAQADRVVELAILADRLGLDLVGVQDHPYQPRLLDMWTLLSTLAGVTERIRLFPDVASLPLRPPAGLARAAASLDIISDGRVELGLGSGAFPRGIASMGGPERDPGDAVDALAEALTVIRSLWNPGPPVTFEGNYYTLRRAQPGPVPPHPIGIWLGSYKPRMLRLTGRMADGWVPTLAYAAPDTLGGMAAIIDAAARDGGREPAAIRRVYNIAGRFSSIERGFLDGPPQVWIAQLTDLVLEHGFSGFVLAPGGDGAADLERFATEVAPGVRAAVAALRQGTGEPPARTAPSASPVSTPRASAAPHSVLLDESARPHAARTEDGPFTAAGRASRQTLVQVHDHLRHELGEIQRAAQAVAGGQLHPAAARSLLNRMAISQTFWTLGSFCAQYCRVVTVHHTIEDRHMFPALRAEDESLSAVLTRLHEEHEIIAEVVERFDRSLVTMLTAPDGIADVQRLAGELGDALLSHLAYEEGELLGPLGRPTITV